MNNESNLRIITKGTSARTDKKRGITTHHTNWDNRKKQLFFFFVQNKRMRRKQKHRQGKIAEVKRIELIIMNAKARQLRLDRRGERCRMGKGWEKTWEKQIATEEW